MLKKPLVGLLESLNLDPELDYMEYSTPALAQAAYVSNSDTYTKLLSHFDIAKATSVLAATGQTITYVGTADCQTTEKKWTGSLLLDGNSDYVTIPDSNDWNFGTGDFTIDCWLRFNNNSTDQSILGQGDAAGNYSLELIARLSGGSPNLYINFSRISDGAVVGRFTCPLTLSADTWYHLAVERNGTAGLMFIDGVSQTVTEAVAWGTLPDYTEVLQVGRVAYDPSPRYFNGYIDELRISKGIARWTENFTPPAAPYEVISLQSFSESAIKTQGDYALKAVAAITDSLNKTLTRTISPPIDCSGMNHWKTDVRALLLGSNFKITLHNDNAATIVDTPDIAVADEYQTEDIDLSAVPDSDKDAIDEIKIEILNADAANTLYIDNMYAIFIAGAAAYRAKKGLISGYHCFVKQYIDFTKLSLAPLKLPDGTLW